MVLESLFPEKKIVSRPVDMLILGFVVSLVSVFVSYFVFPKYAGIITPLITALAMAPLFSRLFEDEEDEIDKVAEKHAVDGFFKRHGEIIWMFTLFFIGNFLAIFLISVVLPDQLLQTVFEPQLSDINAIQSLAAVSGAAGVNTAASDGSAAVSGAAVHPDLADMIILNNLKVMLFAFMLSFLFGTGAVFILSWNASILALFLANYVRQGLYHTLLLTTTGIFPHAAVEMVAYFLAGIAGGILSVGMVREDFMSPEFNLMFKDSVLLLLLALAAVFIGAYIEVGL